MSTPEDIRLLLQGLDGASDAQWSASAVYSASWRRVAEAWAESHEDDPLCVAYTSISRAIELLVSNDNSIRYKDPFGNQICESLQRALGELGEHLIRQARAAVSP